MGRDIGAKCRICRREQQKLFLKGSRCYTEKCALERRKIGVRILLPGQHSPKVIKFTEYGLRLREKQRLKRIYGLREEQFRNYFERAQRLPGVTGENLLILLERRLDNIVYRAGFAKSRPDARQLVLHNHVRVNNKKVNIPSYLIKEGDEVEIKEKSKQLLRIKEALALTEGIHIPSYLEVDREQLKIKMMSLPKREEIEVPIKEQLVVEFYSR